MPRTHVIVPVTLLGRAHSFRKGREWALWWRFLLFSISDKTPWSKHSPTQKPEPGPVGRKHFTSVRALTLIRVLLCLFHFVTLRTLQLLRWSPGTLSKSQRRWAGFLQHTVRSRAQALLFWCLNVPERSKRKPKACVRASACQALSWEDRLHYFI